MKKKENKIKKYVNSIKITKCYIYCVTVVIYLYCLQNGYYKILTSFKEERP